jgi:DNA-binding Xre family transcriptional regulator
VEIIKRNIKVLLDHQGISNYRIHKETGIAKMTLSDLANGKSEIGNMKLDHALKLNEFYKKLEEENKMEKVKFEGREYTLTQDAYLDGLPGETPIFKAAAVDSEGDDFEVTWDVVDNWEEVAELGDDQAMVEDWGSPVSVERL